MAITVSDSGTFTPHPEGQFQAVCVDVVEMLAVPTQYGPKNKIRLVWQTDELMASGKPFLCSRSFTASLAEKSNLRPFLEAWRGKRFTADELKGFDLEVLLGVNAMVQIQHVSKNEKVYDNITAIMRPVKGMTALLPRDYVRRQDRPTEQNGQGHAAPVNAAAPKGQSLEDLPDALEDDEDDLPF